MGLLTGKTAVITGGTRGLGLAIAQAYTHAGAAVVVASRSDPAVHMAVETLKNEGGKASGFVCDVADPEQVQLLADHALQRWNSFDVWVNNAALSAPYGPTAHIPTAAFSAVLQTNILGTYHGSLVALRHFLPRGQGKLINLLGAGARKPVPYQNAYASTKAWVLNFTLAIAREYRHSGVGVYAFNPGLMDTELLEKVQSIAGYERRLQPLKTVMRLWSRPPGEAAQKAVWLASAATDGRTGLVVSQLGPRAMLLGALRDGVSRLAGRPRPDREIHITSIPRAFPVEEKQRVP